MRVQRLTKARDVVLLGNFTVRNEVWKVKGEEAIEPSPFLLLSFRSRRVSSPPDWRWSICPRIDHPHFLKTKILGVAVPRIKHGPCKQRHLELASTQVAKTPLRESEIDFIPFSTLFDSFLSWNCRFDSKQLLHFFFFFLIN